jgi:hypothetical protein
MSEPKPVAWGWTSNQCAAWVIFHSEALVERARQESVDQWLEWADKHSGDDALALRCRAKEWQAAIDDRRIVANEDGLFDPDKVRALFPAPTEPSDTNYLDYFFRPTGQLRKRIAESKEIKGANAKREWLTWSQAVQITVSVRLGVVDWARGSPEEVEWAARWLRANVPIDKRRGYRLVDAAELRAALRKELQPAIDIDALLAKVTTPHAIEPQYSPAADGNVTPAAAVPATGAASPGQPGRKPGSGEIDDESKLREMLELLATKKATSVYSAAGKVAAQHFAEQNRPAATGRLRRKFSAGRGTEPPAGKTWADVGRELHINCI